MKRRSNVVGKGFYPICSLFFALCISEGGRVHSEPVLEAVLASLAVHCRFRTS